MGYLAGIVWCIAFGGLGLFLASQRETHRNYKPFTGRVKRVRTSGRNVAVVDSGKPEIGEFELTFNDLGDYREGQDLACMWDGKDPATAQEDLRGNQQVIIYACWGAVALMGVIFLLNVIF
jgi:hypothetical protein